MEHVEELTAGLVASGEADLLVQIKLIPHHTTTEVIGSDGISASDLAGLIADPNLRALCGQAREIGAPMVESRLASAR